VLPAEPNLRSGTVQLTEPDLAEVVESVVGAMLGIAIDGCGADSPTPRQALGASVQITGPWDGAVVVACDTDFGRRVAAAMFGDDATSMSDEEIADAVGELANMIGGNVKALVGEGTALSLPTVVHGATLSVGVTGAAPCAELSYEHSGARLGVTVYHRQEEEVT
jgi:chemotaxis protein CheX